MTMLDREKHNDDINMTNCEILPCNNHVCWSNDIIKYDKNISRYKIGPDVPIRCSFILRNEYTTFCMYVL